MLCYPDVKYWEEISCNMPLLLQLIHVLEEKRVINLISNDSFDKLE